MLIQDQFGIIQPSPIPQTSFLVETFAASYSKIALSHKSFFLKFRCKVQVNENENKNAPAELFSSHSAYVVRKTARQSKNKQIPKTNLKQETKMHCHFLTSSFYFIYKNKVGICTTFIHILCYLKFHIASFLFLHL